MSSGAGTLPVGCETQALTYGVGPALTAPGSAGAVAPLHRLEPTVLAALGEPFSQEVPESEQALLYCLLRMGASRSQIPARMHGAGTEHWASQRN